MLRQDRITPQQAPGALPAARGAAVVAWLAAAILSGSAGTAQDTPRSPVDDVAPAFRAEERSTPPVGENTTRTLRAHRRARAAEPPSRPAPRSEWSFEVRPPRGFVPTRGTLPATVLESHEDPLAPAFFTVTRLPRAQGLERAKRRVVAEYTSRLERFRVTRDVRLPGPPERWLVEVESGPVRSPLKQRLVFAELGDRLLVLTYTTSRRRWSRYAEDFDVSSRSLTIRSRPIAPVSTSRPTLGDATTGAPRR